MTNPDGSTDFQWRSTIDGASSDAAAPARFPEWVVSVRSGDNFSGYSSPDGVTWTQIGATQTIAMPSSALAGMAVTANDSTASAVFSALLPWPWLRRPPRISTRWLCPVRLT